MIRTSENEEHTKEESRTLCSDFVVIGIYSGDSVRRMFPLVVFFLSVIKLKLDKEKRWERNQKQKILQTQFVKA